MFEKTITEYQSTSACGFFWWYWRGARGDTVKAMSRTAEATGGPTLLKTNSLLLVSMSYKPFPLATKGHCSENSLVPALSTSAFNVSLKW